MAAYSVGAALLYVDADYLAQLCKASGDASTRRTKWLMTATVGIDPGAVDGYAESTPEVGQLAVDGPGSPFAAGALPQTIR